MMRFAKFLEKKGFLKRGALEEIEQPEQPKRKLKKKGGKTLIHGNVEKSVEQIEQIIEQPQHMEDSLMRSSNSEATIYRPAVVLDLERAVTTMNMANNTETKRDSTSSEEAGNTSSETENNDQSNFLNILDEKLKDYRTKEKHKQDHPQPSTSKQGETTKDGQKFTTPEERTQSVIIQAEAAKAQMHEITGMSIIPYNQNNCEQESQLASCRAVFCFCGML